MAIVVNLFAGPGVGKSTTAARVFAELKLKGVNCEMALEFAKDKVWEESFKTMDDQIYIFGKQFHKIWRLKDKVDVIICDSPLPISIVYDKENSEPFHKLIMEQFNKFAKQEIKYTTLPIDGAYKKITDDVMNNLKYYVRQNLTITNDDLD